MRETEIERDRTPDRVSMPWSTPALVSSYHGHMHAQYTQKAVRMQTGSLPTWVCLTGLPLPLCHHLAPEPHILNFSQMGPAVSLFSLCWSHPLGHVNTKSSVLENFKLFYYFLHSIFSISSLKYFVSNPISIQPLFSDPECSCTLSLNEVSQISREQGESSKGHLIHLFLHISERTEW